MLCGDVWSSAAHSERGCGGAGGGGEGGTKGGRTPTRQRVRAPLNYKSLQTVLRARRGVSCADVRPARESAETPVCEDDACGKEHGELRPPSDLFTATRSRSVPAALKYLKAALWDIRFFLSFFFFLTSAGGGFLRTSSQRSRPRLPRPTSLLMSSSDSTHF